jgi:tRNA threonylcarbamoyladenosine modification (KEOPS) complex  Pcc1 subunit
MISCSIKTDHNFEHVQALCKHELARTHERSKTTITNVGGCAVFAIEANDVTALRAAINTITSILAMYEKTTEAIHGRQN